MKPCCSKCTIAISTAGIYEGLKCINPQCECHKIVALCDKCTHPLRYNQACECECHQSVTVLVKGGGGGGSSLEADWEDKLTNLIGLSPYTKENADRILPYLKLFITQLPASQRTALRTKVEGMRKMGGEFGFCKHCKFHKGDYEHDFGTCAAHDKALDQIIKLIDES